ncbi:MAG: tRNA 2-thiouridine(34) synthase MnmA [Planctomycetota bacterium]|nr:tRNA 2-thiouridine(34) synthase MnmA [Planctomycetota bacterium]
MMSFRPASRGVMMYHHKSNKEKVLVAMSGGVDSSVAAGLLLEEGYSVTGVFLCLNRPGETHTASRACCSPIAAADARRVADVLGIRLLTHSVSDAFEPIIEDFAAEYARGRTPNPCIHCNTKIKFARLVELAKALGPDYRYISTGHYARIVERNGLPVISRSRSAAKDQSYALFGIRRDLLGRILLPVGELGDKKSVRRIARRMRLPIHDKPDSQEVCFVPNGDYVGLLRTRAPEALRSGDIVSSDGRLLGRHDGYGRFTIGQRRGIGVAAGEPFYVTRIDPATATVTVGPRDEVMSAQLTASGANWHCDVPPEFEATIQIRYNHRGAKGFVRILDETNFEVIFTRPVLAITPGLSESL